MAQVNALSETEISQQLTEFPEWTYKDSKLYRRLIFEDFVHAFGFMTQLAMTAEKINHHPEWANVYRTVDIFLTTHDISGVSELDFILLKKIESLIGKK
jgi:4a-hydroxytetrahydrobiopterin dehydratase